MFGNTLSAKGVFTSCFTEILEYETPHYPSPYIFIKYNNQKRGKKLFNVSLTDFLHFPFLFYG